MCDISVNPQGHIVEEVSLKETDELLEFAKNLAKEAGEMIRVAFNKPRGDYDRKSKTDPVTETDRAVEAAIFGKIRERYPSHELIGEESASEAAWTDAPTWIVDPIDGTANFVHRIPMCAVSIGVTVGKKLVVGVIYNPLLEEMFEATHRTCSLRNGAEIRVSSVEQLSGACVSTEAGSDRSDGKIEYIMENLKAVLRNEVQCVRMMGSCALNMANVACGRVDVLYERGPHPWDMAAGALLIRQAGGLVYGGMLGGDDEDFDLCGRAVVALTPSLRPSLCGRFP